MRRRTGFFDAVFLGFLLLRPQAQAREDEGIEEEFELLEEALADDEVVSASKERQSILWSPSAISVITREDIRSSGASNVSDLLRRIPGFDVYEVKYSYPLVGARALTNECNNRVLVLVDGREIMVELAGITFWSAFPVALEDIERIEVIRGPGSALYGANAFSAVLNVVTTSDRAAERFVFNLSAGEDGFRRLLARAGDSWNLRDGALSFGASLSMNVKRSPSDRQDLLLKVHCAQGHLRYQAGRSLDASIFAGVVSGSGIFFTHLGDMIMTDSGSFWLMGKADLAIGEMAGLKAQAYFNGQKAKFHSRTSYRAYGIWIADLPDFPMVTPTVDGQVQLDLRLSEDLLAIGGVNLRYTSLHSDTCTPADISDFRGGTFVQAQWNLRDRLLFTGGMRVDLSTEVEPALSPRAVVVYRPWSEHAFRLSYGLAFRKPSLYESQVHPRISDFNPATPEIVAKAATSFGNEELTNERVHSLEAGWRAIVLEDRLHLSVELFFNIYQEVIHFKVDIQERLNMPDIVNSIVQYENEDGAIYAVGGEAEVSWRPDRQWNLWCNLGLRRLSAAGDYVASEPTLRANFGGRFTASPGVFADMALHYVSSYSPPLIDSENILNERLPFSLGNNLLLIGRLGYSLELKPEQTLEAGLTVRAPLGLAFREYPGVPIQPTRQTVTAADFGGDLLRRWVSFYLRGSF